MNFSRKHVAAFALGVVLSGGFLSLVPQVQAATQAVTVFLTRWNRVITTYPALNAFSVGSSTPNTTGATTTPNIAKLSVWGVDTDPWGGLLQVGSSTSSFLFVGNSGKVGLGTTTPAEQLDIFSTGTTTVRIDNNSSTKGSCLVMKSAVNTYYYFIVNSTTGTWATTTSSNCL